MGTHYDHRRDLYSGAISGITSFVSNQGVKRLFFAYINSYMSFKTPRDLLNGSNCQYQLSTVSPSHFLHSRGNFRRRRGHFLYFQGVKWSIIDNIAEILFLKGCRSTKTESNMVLLGEVSPKLANSSW